MAARCAGTKQTGGPCTLPARPPSKFCWAHDPEHAEHRRQTASKAGRSRGVAWEIREVKARIRELAEGVVEGNVDKGRASVAFQGLGVLCRFIEAERRVKEAEELEQRIAELEAQAQEGHRWGA